MATYGCQICNHTYSHEYFDSLSNQRIIDEIKKWEKIANEVFGSDYIANMKKYYPYLRVPGFIGSDDKRVQKVINQLGYKIIGCDVETMEEINKHNYQNEGKKNVDKNYLTIWSILSEGSGYYFISFQRLRCQRTIRSYYFLN